MGALAVGAQAVQPLEVQTLHEKAFDVEALTDAFYFAYCQAFARVEAATTGFADTPEGRPERRAWAQRLMNRLMFLRFVEKKGWLSFDNSTDYLAALYKKGRDESDFYQNRLAKLFFLGLNNPSNISLTATSNGVLTPFIGSVPFLNGGLFEKTALDSDTVSIPPAVLGELIGPEGLFYRFNFTIDESTPFDVAVAVDPEMLGNVFEKLVISEELRSQSGSYYTPKTIVSFMCREALKQFLGGYEKLVDEHDASELPNAKCRELLQQLETVRVVDPACGSGAYLLGMLHELHGILRALDTKSRPVGSREDYELKLQIIQRNLYGVDLQPFATEIARLRLWLSLAVDSTQPRALPNLKFKIESGDSLAAPSPTGIGTLFSGDAERLADDLAARKEEHFKAHGGRKTQLESEIELLETKLTLELSQNAAALPEGAFHWRVRFAEVFTPRHEAVTPFGTLNLGVQLPADPQSGGFDIVVANPPYGSKQSEAIRNAFFVPSSGESQSKDAYGLFMARGLQLLRAGGTFSFIVSDTWRTIKSHKPLRKRVLRETTLLHVVDLPSWVFREPTVNTGIVTLKREAAPDGHHLVTADVRPLAPNDWATLDLNLRVVAAHGPDAQTLDFARYTYPQSLVETYENASVFIASPQLYRLMSDARFQKLGAIADVKVGLQTGDNEFYLRKRAAARGSYRILDESKLLFEAEIAALSAEEKRDGVDPEKYGGRHFVLYDKGGAADIEGGWLPNYYVPTEYFIDWSTTTVERLRTATIADVKTRKGELKQIRASDKTTRAAVIRNPRLY